MSALTAAKDTPRKVTNDSSRLGGTVKGGVKCYEGGLAVYGPGAVSGIYVQPGSTATGLFALGRFTKTVDNTSGTDGLDVNGVPISADIDTGLFRWANGDSIANGDIGKPAYVVDDQTVSKGSSGKSLAGMIVYVDSSGVWVWTSPEALALVAASLAAAAAAQTTANAAVPAATVQYAHALTMVAGVIACTTLNITASSIIIPLREVPDATAAHWGALTITSPVVGAPGSFNIHSANASDVSVVGAVVIN